MRGSGGRGQQGALPAACHPERHSPFTHSLTPAPAGHSGIQTLVTLGLPFRPPTVWQKRLRSWLPIPLLAAPPPVPHTELHLSLPPGAQSLSKLDLTNLLLLALLVFLIS